MKRKPIIESNRWLQIAVCIILLLIFVAVHFFIPDFYHNLVVLTTSGNIRGLIGYIGSFGYGAMAISIFMIVLTNMTGLPSLPFLIVNGIMFGLIPGIIISWIGEFLGNEAGFLIMRTVLRGYAQRLIEKSNMLSKIDSYSTIKNVAIARAIPYSPNVLFTALIAMSKIGFRDHTAATFVGKLPAVVIEVWLGHDLIHIQQHGGRLLALVMGIAVAYGIYHYYKRKKST